MLNQEDLKKLMQLAWSESGCLSMVYKKDGEQALEQERERFLKQGMMLKEEYRADLGYIFVPFIPFLPERRMLSWAVAKQIKKEGLRLRYHLGRGYSDPYPHEIAGNYAAADGRITQITVSPETREIRVDIENILDYDDLKSPTMLRIHLKGVRQYQVLLVKDGEITLEDNQEKQLCREYAGLCGRSIKDDFYICYKDGLWFFCIIVPEYGCIQADCEEFESEKEVMYEELLRMQSLFDENGRARKFAEEDREEQEREEQEGKEDELTDGEADVSEEAGNQPMSNIVVYGTDFKITLHSAHYVYDREGMDEGAPLDFGVSVEYTGDEPEVLIWREDPLVVMALEAEDPEIQKKLANMGVDGVLVADALAKGQATEISWTGKREFEEIGSIPKGNYHVRADVYFIYFALDEGKTERIECRMELPFVID